MHIIKRMIDDVKGFMDEDEGAALLRIAQEASRMGPCLEIGSYCGKSTIYLGRGCVLSNGLLFSIDHHRGSEEQQPGEEYFDPELVDIRTGIPDTLPEFRKNILKAELEAHVVALVSESRIVARYWSIPLSLVFIDGGHSYAAAFADYSCWSRHIVTGGYLLVHDIFKDPSAGGQAPYDIYKLALASGIFKELPMVKTLGVLQRL